MVWHPEWQSVCHLRCLSPVRVFTCFLCGNYPIYPVAHVEDSCMGESTILSMRLWNIRCRHADEYTNGN